MIQRVLSHIPGLLAVLVVPFYMHFLFVTGVDVGWAGFIVSLQSAAVTWLALSVSRGSVCSWHWVPRGLVCLAMSCLTGGLCWLFPKGLVAASAIPHAISYAGFLTLFMTSLMPGREPIVTTVARRLRGPLPEVLRRYTRSVTIAWCVFFAAQILCSLALGVLASADVIRLAVWSQFTNVWNIPLIVVMFAGEYALRRTLHAGENPSRFVDVLRAASRLRPTGPDYDR